jgi:hypothetical protein
MLRRYGQLLTADIGLKEIRNADEETSADNAGATFAKRRRSRIRRLRLD